MFTAATTSDARTLREHWSAWVQIVEQHTQQQQQHGRTDLHIRNRVNESSQQRRRVLALDEAVVTATADLLPPLSYTSSSSSSSSLSATEAARCMAALLELQQDAWRKFSLASVSQHRGAAACEGPPPRPPQFMNTQKFNSSSPYPRSGDASSTTTPISSSAVCQYPSTPSFQHLDVVPETDHETDESHSTTRHPSSNGSRSSNGKDSIIRRASPSLSSPHSIRSDMTGAVVTTTPVTPTLSVTARTAALLHENDDDHDDYHKNDTSSIQPPAAPETTTATIDHDHLRQTVVQCDALGTNREVLDSSSNRTYPSDEDTTTSFFVRHSLFQEDDDDSMSRPPYQSSSRRTTIASNVNDTIHSCGPGERYNPDVASTTATSRRGSLASNASTVLQPNRHPRIFAPIPEGRPSLSSSSSSNSRNDGDSQQDNNDSTVVQDQVDDDATRDSEAVATVIVQRLHKWKAVTNPLNTNSATSDAAAPTTMGGPPLQPATTPSHIQFDMTAQTSPSHTNLTLDEDDFSIPSALTKKSNARGIENTGASMGLGLPHQKQHHGSFPLPTKKPLLVVVPESATGTPVLDRYRLQSDDTSPHGFVVVPNFRTSPAPLSRQNDNKNNERDRPQPRMDPAPHPTVGGQPHSKNSNTGAGLLSPANTSVTPEPSKHSIVNMESPHVQAVSQAEYGSCRMDGAVTWDVLTAAVAALNATLDAARTARASSGSLTAVTHVHVRRSQLIQVLSAVSTRTNSPMDPLVAILCRLDRLRPRPAVEKNCGGGDEIIYDLVLAASPP